MFDNTKCLYTKYVITSYSIHYTKLYETYHIRLAIADAADPIFDSGVFLKAGSFNSGTIPLVKNITDWVMVNTTYEGCSNNLTFARSDNNNIDEPLDFNIEIGGTAIPGVDYSPIPLSLQIP